MFCAMYLAGDPTLDPILDPKIGLRTGFKMFSWTQERRPSFYQKYTLWESIFKRKFWRRRGERNYKIDTRRIGMQQCMPNS